MLAFVGNDIDAFYGSAYTKCTGRGVDVLPTKRTDLAYPQARMET